MSDIKQNQGTNGTDENKKKYRFFNSGDNTLLGAFTNVLVDSNSISSALLFLRLIISMYMMKHGIDKILDFETLKHTFPDPFGLGVEFTLWVSIFTSIVFSIFIFLGLFTRISVIIVTIKTLLLILFIYVKEILTSGEVPLLSLVILIVLLVVGAGKYSVDAYIQHRLGNMKFWDFDDNECKI